MADISKITPPGSQTTYNLKDATAREQAEENKNNISLLNKYGGGKNKLAYTVNTAKALNTSSAYSWNGNACTVNGITYTFNSDGTISATGTILDTSTNAILSLVYYTGVSGDVLSAEQSGSAYIYLRGGNTSTASGPYAEWSSGDIGVSRTVAIVVYGGAGTVNLVFKPMVSTKADYNVSSAYQPYALPNTTLTQQTAWNTDNGVKNLVDSKSGSGTRWINVPVDLPIGTYTVGFGSLSGSDSGVSQVGFYNENYEAIQPISARVSKGTNVSVSDITITGVAKFLRVYAAGDSTTSIDKSIAYTDLFICSKSAWDASNKLTPYSLPNTKITPELIELVDSGAKNLWATPNGTVSGWRETFNGVLPKGDYVISFTNLTSTDTDADTCQIIGVKNGSVVSNYAQCPRGNNVYTTLSLTSDIDSIWIYSSNTSGSGDGDTATFTGCMICSKSAWDVSQKFVPYRPSYEETVEQVAENKNNILLKQDKPTASGERYNTTDTYASYVTLTIPANRVCKVSAALSFSNSQPRGIAISQTNDSSTFDTNVNLIGQKVETSEAVPQLIAEGYCSFSTQKTLYIWAKSASAASNSIFASVEYLS